MLLKGKKGIITGIANNMSIAWTIAEFAKTHGAELALTYQGGPSLAKRIAPLADELGCDLVVEYDVTKEGGTKDLFNAVSNKWDNIDFIVHAIAYSDKNELKGKYLDTSLSNFQNSMHISCFSLVEMCREAQELLSPNSSILTLSYLGAEKYVPNYNVMGVAKAALEASVRYLAADLGERGIRVNAISAGPIRTLAASVIGDFRSMLRLHESSAPLKRNTTQQDVAGAAVYLLSDLSSGVSGEIHYVDCGYNIVGVPTQQGMQQES